MEQQQTSVASEQWFLIFNFRVWNSSVARFPRKITLNNPRCLRLSGIDNGHTFYSELRSIYSTRSHIKIHLPRLKWNCRKNCWNVRDECVCLNIHSQCFRFGFRNTQRVHRNLNLNVNLSIEITHRLQRHWILIAWLHTYAKQIDKMGERDRRKREAHGFPSTG